MGDERGDSAEEVELAEEKDEKSDVK